MPGPTVKGSYADGNSPDRDETDWYATPRPFTRALFDEWTPPKGSVIWDPGAGDGAILDVVLERGYEAVGSDIKPRAPGIHRLDFLECDRPHGDVIITNPPYSRIIPFVEKSLSLCESVAMVMAIGGLTNSKRYQSIWGPTPPSLILLSGRRQHIRSERGVIQSQFSHVWVVWNSYSSYTEFRWCPDVVYKD